MCSLELLLILSVNRIRKTRKTRTQGPLQTDVIFGSLFVNGYAISSEKSCSISMQFLLTYIDVKTVKCCRLLNPEF